MAAPVHQLEIFYDDLAYKPYCAEYLDRGLDILPKREAIKRRSVHDKFHRILVLSGFFFLKIASTFLNSSFFPKPIKRKIAI